MNERGLAESTEWALVLPIVLGVVLGLVQTGVWLHARTVAAEAAAVAVSLRAATGARTSAAEVAARTLANEGGLQDVAVVTSVLQGVVRVTVSGRAPVFFDLGQAQVSERAVLPLEPVGRA